jgi:pyruvate-ferredoxin/flavodoxin oxidoreductase
MIEGFIDGLTTRRPALFNLYTTCQPEHGVADDMGVHQAKLAMESRAYPIFKYNPDLGIKVQEGLDLTGNPAISELWPTYELKYEENGLNKTMKVAMTFADFAITEARFRKHFRNAPRNTWNDKMIVLSEFLEMDADEREGKFPYIWAVDRKNQLSRVLVAQPIVESCEERRDFWILLRDLTGKTAADTTGVDLEQKIRTEVVNKMAQKLMQLVGGNGNGEMPEIVLPSATKPAQTQAATATETPAASNGSGMAPWLETDECTSCDECINLNAQIFAYNADKKAYIKDPKGGPYRDLVMAAEKCTAQVIHPGLPADMSEKDMDKWVKRGEKHN